MLRLVFALTIACTACGTPPATAPTAQPEPSGNATPAPVAESETTVVFLVRHAEKASDGSKDPPLTEAGQTRADCLARVLGEVGVTHVFATQLQRTQKTVAPLAAAAGVEVVSLPAGDNAALIEQLDGLPPGSVAVAAGHSNTVPAIASEIAAPLKGLDDKGYLPHEQYDTLVEVVRAPGIAPRLVQLRYCAPSAVNAQ